MATLTPRNNAKAPEKGIFPLDHFAECKHVADQYLLCLQHNDGDAAACIELSKAYLHCRMDRNLMVRQELSELGLDDEAGRRKFAAANAATAAANAAAGASGGDPKKTAA